MQNIFNVKRNNKWVTRAEGRERDGRTDGKRKECYIKWWGGDAGGGKRGGQNGGMNTQSFSQANHSFFPCCYSTFALRLDVFCCCFRFCVCFLQFHDYYFECVYTLRSQLACISFSFNLFEFRCECQFACFINSFFFFYFFDFWISHIQSI